MSTIPEELLEQFERGNVLLLVGKRINQGILPSSRELATELAKRCDYPPEEPLSLARVASYYELTRDRHGLVQFLREKVLKKTNLHTIPSVHQLVTRLDVRVIITTCVDQLLVRALDEANITYTQVVGNSEVAYSDEERLLLVYLCGVLDQPDSLIITEDDQRGFLDGRANLSDVLRGELAQRTWLFIGFGASDEWFRGFYEQVTRTLDRHSRRVYLLGSDLGAFARAWWHKKNAEILDIEIKPFLQQLTQELAARRERTPAIPSRLEAYRIFISYANKNQTFVERLADDLQKKGFKVKYEKKIRPGDDREAYLRHQMGNWPDFCIFVVCQEFSNPSDPNQLPKEMEWAKLRASQVHRPFKMFWVQVEACEVSIELNNVPWVNFIDWQQTATYQICLRQLLYHLHYHRYDPHLFVNRQQECEECAGYLLDEKRSTPGVLIYNKHGRQGLGNSMLLWYLRELYLPRILSDRFSDSYAIIDLDWAELVHDMGPVEWMEKMRRFLQGGVDFADFDKKLQSIKAAGKVHKRRQTQQKKQPRRSRINPGPHLSTFLLQNRRRSHSALTHAAASRLTPDQLMELTKEFLNALQNGQKKKIVCLVDGPSGSKWHKKLGQIKYDWLTNTFNLLNSIPKVCMVLAGTYPLFEPKTVHLPVIELDRLSLADTKQYVHQRLAPFMPYPNDSFSKDLIAQTLWNDTQGHPGKMFEKLENVLRDRFGRTI